MSNRSVVADGPLDALCAALDVASDIADVLPGAADGVATAQATQESGPDYGEKKFGHTVSEITGPGDGLSRELQCASPEVPVEFERARPNELMSSPKPRAVLQPATKSPM